MDKFIGVFFLACFCLTLPVNAQTGTTPSHRSQEPGVEANIPPGYSANPESRRPPARRPNPRTDPNARRIRERLGRNSNLSRDRFLNRGYFQRELARAQGEWAPKGVKISMESYELMTYREYYQKYDNTTDVSSAEVSPDRVVAVLIFNYQGRVELHNRMFLDPRVISVRDGITGEIIESTVQAELTPEEKAQYQINPFERPFLQDSTPLPKM